MWLTKEAGVPVYDFGAATGRDPSAAPADRDRGKLRRRFGSPPEDVLDAWLALDERAWVLAHGPDLWAAGLSADDAQALHRRLGASDAQHLGHMIVAGRLAGLTISNIHLWAASGLLASPAGGPRRRRSPTDYTRWVTQARRYIRACDGDERLAAATAAAGFSPEDARSAYTAGKLELDGLLAVVALREAVPGTHD